MRPPRFARRLVAWLAPPDVRAWLLDDLDDAFGRRAAVDAGRARRWYWRQTLSGSLTLTAMRLPPGAGWARFPRTRIVPLLGRADDHAARS